MMEYRELTDAFASKYGVAAPHGEDGIETIEIDGTHVTFHEDVQARAVILSAQVGAMPPDAKGRFAAILLKASGILSANAEGAFCVDEDDVLHVVRSMPLALADLDSLIVLLEALVDLAEIWREHAAAFAGVDDEISQREIEEAALNPLICNMNFIKV